MRSKCICVKDYNGQEAWAPPNLQKYNSQPEFSKGEYYEYTKNVLGYTEGYNVQFSNGEYIFFRKGQDPLTGKGYRLFSKYFKTIKKIRKEKLEKLNKLN